jgi:hypothetical protein
MLSIRSASGATEGTKKATNAGMWQEMVPAALAPIPPMTKAIIICATGRAGSSNSAAAVPHSAPAASEPAA